ncbi:hypothetical protein PMIN07_009928 [Paraphaeosphaeria minitans]
MLVAVLTSLLAVPGLFLIWSALSLQANKKKAETTGLPLLVRWVTPINPFWLLCGSSIVLKCRAWGIGTKNFHRFYTFGWEANERHIVHEELGPAFMLVSPGGNWLCVSDASVFAEVIHRRTDFRRNMEQFELLNVYGKNLATTDDEEWQKHRKITAITFTERNNELVWKQSISQARGMIEYWLKHQHVNTTADDTKMFTLNVLAAAIFNKSYSYHGAAEAKAEEKDDNDSHLYRDSLGRILGHVIPILICGEQGLKAWWTPKTWKEVSNSIATFRSYVTGLINEERANIERGEQNNQHLVAAVVRACEREKHEASGGKRPATLTEQEIISNMFVYAFAGNDTTAIVLNHLLVNLAAHPDSQEWVAEEIRHYLPDNDRTTWAYTTFPKLKRCQAVIMEALRLAHPLGQLVKGTGAFPQTIQIGSRAVTLPPNTVIQLSLAAMHTHPTYWGQDPLQWNPSRFITTPPTDAIVNAPIEAEILASDTAPHFLPWATGQRVCPGRKFSQVELVAALAVLLRDHVVSPQPNAGESLEAARKRVFATGLEIEHEGSILHEMRHSKSIALTWRRRGE